MDSRKINGRRGGIYVQICEFGIPSTIIIPWGGAMIALIEFPTFSRRRGETAPAVAKWALGGYDGILSFTPPLAPPSDVALTTMDGLAMPELANQAPMLEM